MDESCCVSEELDKARTHLEQGNHKKTLNELWTAEARARTDLEEARGLVDVADQLMQQSEGRVQREAKDLRAKGQAKVVALSAPAAPPAPRFRVGMPVSTSNEIPGWEITAYIGEVFGLVVRSRGGSRNLARISKSVFGDELKTMTNLLRDTRLHAIARPVEAAEERGADGVIATRFDVASMGDSAGWTEVCAYGTAVQARKLHGVTTAVVAPEGWPDTRAGERPTRE
jgi:uncharacterized protein YbjQ (UPF0145 family)